MCLCDAWVCFCVQLGAGADDQGRGGESVNKRQALCSATSSKSTRIVARVCRILFQQIHSDRWVQSYPNHFISQADKVGGNMLLRMVDRKSLWRCCSELTEIVLAVLAVWMSVSVCGCEHVQMNSEAHAHNLEDNAHLAELEHTAKIHLTGGNAHMNGHKQFLLFIPVKGLPHLADC